MIPQYQILFHRTSLSSLSLYQQELSEGKKPGNYLAQELTNHNVGNLTNTHFLQALINSKLPRIYAETKVQGNGADWNLDELRLMGDISVAAPVTVFDNGLHNNPTVHDEPFQATLIFTPGALLRNDRGNIPADWDEATQEGKIFFDGYYALYERRLLPGLLYANQRAKELGRMALVTLPGIGCGQFAGPFRGQMGEFLKRTLLKLLENNSEKVPYLRVIYFDPYSECQNERHEINQISFMVRPLSQGNGENPQLCLPANYQEDGDDFLDCDLYSIVAWDHVSWPGNDFYGGMRSTDDGVKAAATDSMWKITGIEGQYDNATNKYQPPEPYYNWEEVVKKNKLKLIVEDNLSVFL